MLQYSDIIDSFNNNDMDNVGTLSGLLDYKNDLKRTFQSNLVELFNKTTTKIFLKLYSNEEDKWEFADYGWLVLDNDRAYFRSNKSKLTFFSIVNIKVNLLRHQNSQTHIIAIDNYLTSHLLYNPYPEVISMAMKMINAATN